MSFSERLGIVEEKPIQINSMNEKLRIRLYNSFMNFRKDHQERYKIHFMYDQLCRYILDKLGVLLDGQDYANSIEFILKNDKTTSLKFDRQWYTVYDLFEYLMEAQDYVCKKCLILNCRGNGGCYGKDFLVSFPKELNRVLEEEKSGYRMINGRFAPITNETEIQSIVETIDSEYNSVSEHMKKALTLYSDRKSPNYVNSINESIHAVESMCCIITGKKTLGDALKKLKDNGVKINQRLEKAFELIYAYTNQETRHGSDEYKNAPAEDAKYMLVSCSAFVNYLIEKYGKISQTT